MAKVYVTVRESVLPMFKAELLENRPIEGKTIPISSLEEIRALNKDTMLYVDSESVRLSIDIGDGGVKPIEAQFYLYGLAVGLSVQARAKDPPQERFDMIINQIPETA